MAARGLDMHRSPLNGIPISLTKGCGNYACTAGQGFALYAPLIGSHIQLVPGGWANEIHIDACFAKSLVIPDSMAFPANVFGFYRCLVFKNQVMRGTGIYCKALFSFRDTGYGLHA